MLPAPHKIRPGFTAPSRRTRMMHQPCRCWRQFLKPRDCGKRKERNSRAEFQAPMRRTWNEDGPKKRSDARSNRDRNSEIAEGLTTTTKWCANPSHRAESQWVLGSSQPTYVEYLIAFLLPLFTAYISLSAIFTSSSLRGGVALHVNTPTLNVAGHWFCCISLKSSP